MTFKLRTAGDYYKEDEKAELEKLGFIFVASIWHNNVYHIINKGIDIEINSLDELDNLVKEYGSIIIEPTGELVIYDGYME